MSNGAKIKRPSVSACNLDKPIAIIAGGGKIPMLLAQFIKAQGGQPFIFAVKGNADAAVKQFDHCEVSTSQIGTLIAVLKKKNITQLVLVGSVNGRPRLRDFRPDLATLNLASSIITGLKRGDDNLLTALIRAIEAEGVTVFGVHEVMPSLIAPEGALVGTISPKILTSSIEQGIQAARLLGGLDAGQGCVVLGERIVALEGAEGTDQMLERIADLRAQGRLPNKRGGVLVKVSKPQQDQRVDLPTIGVSTVDLAAKAQLLGIAISAKSSLIVDVEAVTAAAEAANIFIYGVASDGA